MLASLDSKEANLEKMHNQQLCDLVKDLQERDLINKQMIQKLIDSIDSNKANSAVKNKLSALESALLQLSKDNNMYKNKLHSICEQKIELIEFIHAKNAEIEALQKEIVKLEEECDDRISKTEPKTNDSSSVNRNQSDAILALLKLMEIPLIGNRYNEENLKTMIKNYEQMISK